MKRLRSKTVFMKKQIARLQDKNCDFEIKINEHANEIEELNTQINVYKEQVKQ
jgi:peptidoglycan hydrolase CwlO-like protein